MICSDLPRNVKECDRLNVAVEMLTRLGLEAEYRSAPVGDGHSSVGTATADVGMDDKVLVLGGLVGDHPKNLPKKLFVDCKKDHRVAMTAAVLACGLSAIGADVVVEIDDLRVVDKTYPSFWEDMAEKFGVVLGPDPKTFWGDGEGAGEFSGGVPAEEFFGTTAQTAAGHSGQLSSKTMSTGSAGSGSSGATACSTSSATAQNFALRRLPLPPSPKPLPPICMVGLPGSGKSVLAQAAAHHFGLKLLTLDEEILSTLLTDPAVKTLITDLEFRNINHAKLMPPPGLAPPSPKRKGKHGHGKDGGAKHQVRRSTATGKTGGPNIR